MTRAAVSLSLSLFSRGEKDEARYRVGTSAAASGNSYSVWAAAARAERCTETERLRKEFFGRKVETRSWLFNIRLIVKGVMRNGG